MKKRLAIVFAQILLCVFSLSCKDDKGAATPLVKFETNRGDFIVELYPQKAPNTVTNFMAYVDEGFYNGTIFHRVIKSFMIQGGGYTESFYEKPTRHSIENESENGLKNNMGSIAMARTQDPDSATAQFFINTHDNPSLDYQEDKPGYTVFGKVLEGYSVIEVIENQSVGSSYGHQDVPLDKVIIRKVTRL